MIKVNLLSPEKKDISGAAPEAAPFPEEEKERKINTGAIIGAAVITLGIIGLLYFTQAQTLQSKQQHLQERRARKKALDNVLKTLEELEKAKKMLDNKVKLISDLKRSQKDAVKMMDHLCDALPDWVWLTSLSFNSRKLSMSGKAIHNNLISDFINNLKGTGCFYDIELGSSTRQRGSQEVFNFKLSCLYRDKDEVKKSKTKQKRG
ncbi:MAG: PilN domain-containing protein [Candidatus Aminicenantes bacterium]|nr:MAG: PilN domain-containing protein [Candidatus Aminicenantes bacterium]